MTTDRDDGYLQALKDVQATVRKMVDGYGMSPDGKVELLGVVSFLDSLIRTKTRRHSNHDEQDAPDPLSGSF